MSTTWNIQGKTVLVTGGTQGIGYETAHALAAAGANVIIAARDTVRGAAAVVSLQQQTGSTNVSFVSADLSLLSEVRRLAEHIIAHYPQLHVLVNNVGNANALHEVTAEGLEITFVRNHLGPFLLTNLLLPLLEASAPARIINVSSGVHRFGHMDFTDLQSERNYKMMPAYEQAKLANLLFTYELARRLSGTNVTVNAADPLGTITAVKKVPFPFVVRLILPLFTNFLTVERAGRSPIYLASSPEMTGITGKYVDFRRKIIRSSPASYDEAAAKKLWLVSAELVGLTQMSQSH